MKTTLQHAGGTIAAQTYVLPVKSTGNPSILPTGNAVAGSIPEQAVSCEDREGNGKCSPNNALLRGTGKEPVVRSSVKDDTCRTHFPAPVQAESLSGVAGPWAIELPVEKCEHEARESTRGSREAHLQQGGKLNLNSRRGIQSVVCPTHSNSTYEVADIVKPGAILPLSIPLYEYFDADWEAKADAVYCWLCAADATDRVPYPVEIKAKVDLVCDRYENEFMVEADGCGNDSDLWDWSRGG